MAGVAVRERGGLSACWRDLSRPQRLRAGGCVGYLVLLTLLFCWPLVRLASYAADSKLDSYILLVPFVAGYLLYIQRKPQPAGSRSSIVGTVAVDAEPGFYPYAVCYVDGTELLIGDPDIIVHPPGGRG